MGWCRFWWAFGLLALARAGGAATPEYAGASSCAKCHAEAHRLWSQSRHSKMVQPASAAGVRGDFTRGKIALRGLPYAVSRRNGAFYITESYLYGKPVEHRVDY